jgi:hypothetical protein
LLIRANDHSASVLNGEIVVVDRIEAGVIQTTDGRRIETRAFREFSHGFAVTSHASQGKTVEHVVVAAERLNAKAAYVACSRGQVSCFVHTPDKAALLDRLPDGNRAAALDLLASEQSLAKQVLDRSRVWVQSIGSMTRDLPEAVRRVAAQILNSGQIANKERMRQAHYQLHGWDGNQGIGFHSDRSHSHRL